VADAAAAPITLRPIGVVRSPVTEGRDDGWGDVVAELRLDPSLAHGLDGITAFSHVVVIYWMHEATFDEARDLVRRPRGRDDMPELGIFAQRAKHRPNPIGITAVRLIGRDGAVLRVQGLDAIDGSPVLDIKPYASHFDCVRDPVEPDWLARLMDGYF
jgi:tRNA-Thr(GGU) m(6)t(6)A37 methyltransferase TsaA